MLSKKGWAGIKAFGRCKCMSIRDGKETTAIRYYILSYSNLELFAKTSRNHWAIENNLHWVLDTVFSEDTSRKRKDHAPRNYALIRKFVLNISGTLKGLFSIPGLRIQISSCNDFLTEILTTVGFVQRVAAC